MSATLQATQTLPKRSVGQQVHLVVTGLIVGLPVAGLVVAIVGFWGHGVTLLDLVLLVIFYVITGHGVTVGFHRLLTHRSFTAKPALRVALTLAGSMAFQGGVIGWVATHRKHHAHTDVPGDPHSPHTTEGEWGWARGALHAHMGWLFGNSDASPERYAPDLLAEPFMRMTDRLFPLFCLVSLGLPLLTGYLLTFTVRGMLMALLWAGLIRIFVLHHVTWSINSLCHMIGKRPYLTREGDHSTNLWPLALVSMGESWHNLHHADPTSARHGVRPGQLDSSARLIRIFEQLGWASDVRWPTPERIAARTV